MEKGQSLLEIKVNPSATMELNAEVLLGENRDVVASVQHRKGLNIVRLLRTPLAKSLHRLQALVLYHAPTRMDATPLASSPTVRCSMDRCQCSDSSAHQIWIFQSQGLGDGMPGGCDPILETWVLGASVVLYLFESA